MPSPTELSRAPLETWWGLVDLWSRLHQLAGLQAIDVDTLLLPGWRRWGGEAALRDAVFDLDRYAWNLNGARDRGSFVHTLDYEGDDLVCSLMPLHVVRHWPEGASLVLLRWALMSRLAQAGTLGAWA